MEHDMTDLGIRMGVDIGGTFTDVVLEKNGVAFSTKGLTTYAAPENAIIDGMHQVCQKADVTPGQIDQIIHGTTLATNALIERRGAKTALITTEGFRDVIEMRTESRFEQYDLNLNLPDPLLPRQMRFTVPGRVDANGKILVDLDRADVEAVVDRIAAAGFESVAVGLIHSYLNPTHEALVRDVLADRLPDVSVSISSEVSPQMREYERFNTVVANAYIKPLMASYLGRLEDRLKAEGAQCRIFLMHSGGGIISIQNAAEFPVRLVESGPAGGAVFAANVAAKYGLEKVLSFDMGGTTAKICLIEDGAPKTANTFEVARTYRFKKGSGMTVSTPVVEMVEIGAGGGSIASIDSLGRIQVGPRSAASEPGPACYGRGGTEPTVTDSNLLLGRLDPENFAGGAIPLSVDAATRAVTDTLAQALNLEAADAAFGVTEMVDENMANAARVHTVENGRDIEHFTMIGFGGGAPLHACRLCEKLGIQELIIPPGAGVGSAIGFLKAPFSYEATRGLFQRLDAFDAAPVNAALTDLEDEARAFVAAGAGGAETTTRLTAFMRYSGQGWEIPVPLDYAPFADGDAGAILDAFEAAYRTLFGRTIDGLGVEITNWSLVVATVLPPTIQVDCFETGTAQAPLRTRQFFDAALRKTVDAAEVHRSAMQPGHSIAGPAIIIEDETTTIVTSAYRAVGQGDGSLRLIRKGDAA